MDIQLKDIKIGYLNSWKNDKKKDKKIREYKISTLIFNSKY
jgi:hypothetical protein